METNPIKRLNNMYKYTCSLYTFKGRATRKEMWSVLGNFLLYYLGSIVFLAIACLGMAFAIEAHPFAVLIAVIPLGAVGIVGILMLLFALGIGIASAICMVARRMHDFGMTAWIYWAVSIGSGILAGFVYPHHTWQDNDPITALVGLGFFILFYAIPGQKKDNQYGENPYAVKL